MLIVAAVVGLGISYSKLYLFHVVLIIHLIILGTLDRFKIRIPALEMKESWFLLFTFFWYSVTLLWSIQAEYTLRYLFYIFCGNYIVYVMLFNSETESQFKEVFKYMAIFFTLELFICLLEIFTPFRMPVSPLSENLELFGRSETSRLFLVNSTPTGFRWNPNDLAITMVILLPYFMFVKNKYLKIIGTITIFFIVLMTSSRGAFIALIFGLFMYPILFARQKIMRYAMGTVFVAILLFSNMNYFKHHENRQVREISESTEILENYLFGESKESETSIGIRKKLIENGFKALDQTFWLGVGGGCSVAIHELYGGVGTHHVASMHNFWLEIVVEAGIVFGLLFIFWYMHMTMKLYNVYCRSGSSFLRYTAKATTLSFVVFPVAAISSSSTIYLLPMWLLFGVGLVLLKLDKISVQS